MPYDPNLHHRQSHRWRGYDYALADAYFVTICTQHRTPLFGAVVDGEMRLSDAGKMVEWWSQLPGAFRPVDTDAFVVMPNHVHGIVLIRSQDDGGRDPGVPLPTMAHVGAGPVACPLVRLPDVVHWFKTKATDDYIRAVQRDGWPPFPGRVWQRNYHDRVIRSDDELDRVRLYVGENPTNWHLDPDYAPEALA